MKFFQVKTVEETFQLIEESIKPLQQIETVKIEDALNRILAETITVQENVPSFRRSSVDGYAVQAKDTFGSSEGMPSFLNLTGEVKMGVTADKPVNAGEAIYVPTGGMIPEKADAVVMIEHCEDISGLLNIYRQVTPGENVISIGEDLKEGIELVCKGSRLRPQELGALASQGITTVQTYKTPTIGYLSSGDEIVPIESQQVNLGEIRDMNGITIGSLVKQWGYNFKYGGIVKDNRELFEQTAREILEEVDCLVLSGGSSVGTKDYSVDVIDALGSPGVFVHGISIRPGKPTILAVADGKPVIGLPGHPASAMVIFELFGKKVFERLTGNTEEEKNLTYAITTRNVASSAGRTDYIRVKLFEEDGIWYADPIIGKSGLISTLVESDGMIVIASQKEGYQKGDKVPIRLFR